MRTIKFRVWSKESNCFLNNCGFLGLDVDGNLIDTQSSKLDENYIIQQFTGLLDKNNKEIYEGDIVHWMRDRLSERDEVEYCLEDFTFEVVFQNGIFGFYKWYRMNGLPTDFSWSDRKFEVIGNIFENPDLLK